MQPEPPAQSKATSAEFGGTKCPSCHAQLPHQMRFCRACGYRLGEGIEEYVETIRLNPRMSAQARPAATDPVPNAKTHPFQPQDWGAMARQAHEHAQQATALLSSKLSKSNCRGGRKPSWMLWMIIAVISISVTGGGLLTPFALRKRFINIQTAATSRSYAGVNSFQSSDGGAFIDYVTPPGSPADKAGLVGGDVITSFDGKPVKNEDDIMSFLKGTPVGKTVEIVFIRDGQTKTTQLTTTSKEELDRLRNAFKKRPEGTGYIGEGSDIDRVIVPGMNIYGVRLNEISKSRPADMSGLKSGDIVIEFGGTPTRTRRELETRIERAQPYSTVTVVVVRNGERLEIPVKVGIDD